MSLCYNLVCPETKTAIWVGQNSYIYAVPKAAVALAKWLAEHQGKAIFFVDDNSELLWGIPFENTTDYTDTPEELREKEEIRKQKEQTPPAK